MAEARGDASGWVGLDASQHSYVEGGEVRIQEVHSSEEEEV
jgi:hypothetical protein